MEYKHRKNILAENIRIIDGYNFSHAVFIKRDTSKINLTASLLKPLFIKDSEELECADKVPFVPSKKRQEKKSLVSRRVDNKKPVLTSNRNWLHRRSGFGSRFFSSERNYTSRSSQINLPRRRRHNFRRLNPTAPSSLDWFRSARTRISY